MGRGRCGQHPPPACWAVPGRGLRPGFGSWPLRSSRVWGTLGSWDHTGPERPGWDTSKGREESDRHRPAGGAHHTPREKGGCREGGNEGGDDVQRAEVSAKETWTEQKAERERQGVKEGGLRLRGARRALARPSAVAPGAMLRPLPPKPCAGFAAGNSTEVERCPRAVRKRAAMDSAGPAAWVSGGGRGSRAALCPWL